MRLTLALLLLVGLAFAQLPDAPSTTQPPKPPPKFFAMSRPRLTAPLRTNQQVILSKSFLIVHSTWLASIVFTVEAEHQGLAYHRCVGSMTDPHPSRASLYANALPTFGLSIANWAASKYVWHPAAMAIPAAEIIKNIQSGTHWQTECH
jgi:hypothetical protein